MVDRIEAFNVTFTAGTPQSAPVTIPTTFNDGVVTGLEIDVPPGPSGLMGFMFLHSLQQVIPRTTGTFIIADNTNFRWPLTDYPVGGRWSVLGYNTDIYDHTVFIRYLVNELTPAAAQVVALQPIV